MTRTGKSGLDTSCCSAQRFVSRRRFRESAMGPALLASSALAAGIIGMLVMATGIAVPVPNSLLFLIGGLGGLALIYTGRN
jgi:hypothetical protein